MEGSKRTTTRIGNLCFSATAKKKKKKRKEKTKQEDKKKIQPCDKKFVVKQYIKSI